jgi:hypothetical protein
MIADRFCFSCSSPLVRFPRRIISLIAQMAKSTDCWVASFFAFRGGRVSVISFTACVLVDLPSNR